jgi:intracellular multiplication protein IcmJ
MRFLPILPSTHPSAWAVEPDEAEREELAQRVRERDAHTCRFCGHHAISWQAVVEIDGDVGNCSEDNLATACALCQSVQRLGRHSVNDELLLIWLPDISQAALNCIVRRIHLTLHTHGEQAHALEMPRSQAPAVYAAMRAYRGLQVEARTVEARIETSRPGELGAALMGLGSKSRHELQAALGGVRFLHRGHYFRNGRDVYSQVLSAWAAARPRREGDTDV